MSKVEMTAQTKQEAAAYLAAHDPIYLRLLLHELACAALSHTAITTGHLVIP
jgi:hypothetical protein